MSSLNISAATPTNKRSRSPSQGDDIPPAKRPENSANTSSSSSTSVFLRESS